MKINSPRDPRSFSPFIFTAVTFALGVVSTFMNMGVADGNCGNDELKSPAAGHYKGTFRLVYDLILPNVPSTIHTTATWAGDLDFELGRHELDDNPPPAPPPPPPRRNPLRPPSKPPTGAWPSDRAKPGQFKNNEEQVAAYWAAEEKRIRNNEALAEKRLEEIKRKLPPAHLYVSKSDKPKIEGKTIGKIETRITGGVAGVKVDSKGQSTDDLEFRVEGEERNPEEGFKDLSVKGPRSQIGYAFQVTAESKDGRAKHTGRVGPGGAYSGHSTGEVKGRRGESDFSKPGSGSGDNAPLVQLARLFVENKSECATMEGKVDESDIRRMLKAGIPGADIRVIESKWQAKLEERDEGLEKKVDALASQPIPDELTWEYIDSFAQSFAELRSEAQPMTDYKQCLFRQLETKFIQIQLAGIKTLTNNFPKAKDGATCVVMRAMMERILEHERVLQLYGAGACPEVQNAEAVANNELIELLKRVLSHHYTWDELKCFLPLDSAGKLGDMEDPFQSALQGYLAGRPPEPIVIK